MKLGGWTRLWLVLIAIYGTVMVVVSYDKRPSVSRLEGRWVYEGEKIYSRISEEKQNLIKEKEHKTIADKYRRLIEESSRHSRLFRNKSDNEIIEWFKKKVKPPIDDPDRIIEQMMLINNKYQQELRDFPLKRREYYYNAFLWWLLPSAGLFIIGWTIGWVIRGFKKKN